MRGQFEKRAIHPKQTIHSIGFLLSIFFMVWTHTALAASTRPNVVFFYADDLGWGDVGYHDSPVETPHIDRLATEGVQLDHYYTYPICGPSRLSLMTARNPIRLKQSGNLNRDEMGIDLSETFLPQAFQDAGYQTWGLGKWHLGGHDGDAYWPTNRGFDHYYGFMAAATDPYNHTDPQEHGPNPDTDWWLDDQQVTDEDGVFCMDLLTSQALEWIETRDTERPFFLYFSYHAVHSPMIEPPNEAGQHPKTADYYASMFPGDSERQVLASMVSGLDDSVGSVMQMLSDQSLDNDNTIVLFVSDNGGADTIGSSNLPLSGGKGRVLDGGIRVPALIRWPGHLDAGATSSQFMSVLDWYPTLAEACQISEGSHLPHDGTSKWASLRNGTNNIPFEFAVQRDDETIIDGEWKLIDYKPGGLALFNLLTDPVETTDVSGSNPDVVSRLRDALDALNNASDESTTDTFSILSENFPGDGVSNWKVDGGSGELVIPGSMDSPTSPVVDSAQGWGVYPNSSAGDILIKAEGGKITFRNLANTAGSYMYTLFDPVELPDYISIAYGVNNSGAQTARLLLKESASENWYASDPVSVTEARNFSLSNLSNWYAVTSGGSLMDLTGQASVLSISGLAQGWPGGAQVSGFGFYIHTERLDGPLAILSIDLTGVSVGDRYFELTQYDVPTRENFNSFRGTGVSPGGAMGDLNSNAFSLIGIDAGMPVLAFGASASGANFAGGAQSELPTAPGLFALDKGNTDFSLCVAPNSDSMTSGAVVLKMFNRTGYTVIGLDIGFEVIHNNSGFRSQLVSFGHAASYSSNVASYNMAGALDMNTAYSTTTSPSAWSSAWMSASLGGVSIAPDEPYYLLFYADRNAGGDGLDDHIGWDNLSVTPRAEVPPAVTAHPQSQKAALGDSVSLRIEASGASPLMYQWTLNGSDISGANANNYVIDPVSHADVGDYRCVVSNAYGTELSNAATLSLDINSKDLDYPIVDTNQSTYYNAAAPIFAPSGGQPFHGQDAGYIGYQPSYTLSGDGLAVTDNVTRLIWQRSTDRDNDGDIDADDKLTWANAENYPETLNGLNYGGYSDWRFPTIKELYSLILFSGRDPSGYSGTDTSGLIPFIDTEFFEFNYGDQNADERIIDAQYWSATSYVSTTMGGDPTAFGVNFADGRIKGYPKKVGPNEKEAYVLCVRGNTQYGVNDFKNNGDGTITDNATGLMWLQDDSGSGMIWQEALAWAENLTTASYSDWRLPNAKELQSLLDYSRSPGTSASPAIDPLFNCASVTNEAGQIDYPYYWTGTTHANSNEGGQGAAYLSFGRAMGKNGRQLARRAWRWSPA